LSLLLIEDDRADAVLVEELIADSVADIRMAWAPSMAHAEGVLARERPDCVLLDLNLADATGFDGIARIAEWDGTLPVVVLTGLNDEEFGVSAVASGAQDYLVKGRVEPDMLRRTLLYAIERARLVMQAEALDAQAVELRRSNAELEQFAYVASHDLQEPLRKVASFCQLLEQRYGNALDERGIEYIGFAVDGAKRMQVLINDLLTFSRVGRLNVTHATVDLDSTLETALDNLAAAIEESGAQIARPDGPLPQVMGDATLMTMLWQNLIGNAVKFRREDRAPQVIIDCERGTGDHHGHWIFSVADNGIGIAPEFAEKVFVIFQRLHGRDAYTGTGIGLALCKKIVELHGGSIGIHTSDNSGTRFWFTLPITAASDETPIGAAEGAHR
jgi:signal transduction histidine kinase